MLWISAILIVGLQLFRLGSHTSLSSPSVPWPAPFLSSAPRASAPCSSLSDLVRGRCVRVLPLEEDTHTRAALRGRHPLHAFLYACARKALEALCACLLRCLPLACPVAFALSSLVLVGAVWGKRMAKKQQKNKKFRMSKYLLLVVAAFVSSAAGISSVLLPLLLELVVGGVIDFELSNMFENHQPLVLQRIVQGGGGSGASLRDFLDWGRVRRSLLDLSDLPRAGQGALLLQARISLAHWVALAATGACYAVAAAAAYVIIRSVLPRKNKLQILKSSSDNVFRKFSWKHFVSPKPDSSVEHYTQKFLQPGFNKPWREMDFTSSVTRPPRTPRRATETQVRSPEDAGIGERDPRRFRVLPPEKKKLYDAGTYVCFDESGSDSGRESDCSCCG